MRVSVRARSSPLTMFSIFFFFFFQAEDGIRDYKVTGVQTCALPISERQRRGEPGVAVALRQPALQHGLAVAAAQERNLVLVEVLARDIDQHAEQLAVQAAQVLAERRDAEVVAGELRLQLEPRPGAAVEVMVLGREVENAPCGHG